MMTITITLPDEQAHRLAEKAGRLRVPPEALLRASLEELLERPDEAFRQALDTVLQKNADLYRRLA